MEIVDIIKAIQNKEKLYYFNGALCTLKNVTNIQIDLNYLETLRGERVSFEVIKATKVAAINQYFLPLIELHKNLAETMEKDRLQYIKTMGSKEKNND